jgi:predicted MPP superfamily phosphohydrolase
MKNFCIRYKHRKALWWCGAITIAYAEKKEFKRIIEQGGGVFLDNRLVEISREGQKLYLIGLDCSYYHQDDLGALLPKLHYKNANVLIVHEPDNADQYAASGKIGLQLSGHSHGGQIRLPWIGSPWLPRAGRKYPRGLYRFKGMQLYTNSGLGTSSAHLRIGCPPEIALVRLLVQEQTAGKS